MLIKNLSQNPMFFRLNYFVRDFYFYIILVIFSSILTLTTVNFLHRLPINNFKKKVYLSIIIFIFSSILVFTVVEAYFRYVYDLSDGLAFLNVNKKWHQRHVEYNSLKFRDDQFETYKKPGEIRIGVIGDSITFGAGIENRSDRYSDLLETKLKQTYPNVEVYNLGVYGSDTIDQIETYKKNAPLDFDIIIWQYFLNDIQTPNPPSNKILKKYRELPKTIQLLSEKSYFLNFLYWRLTSRYEKAYTELIDDYLNQYKNEQAFEAHKNSLVKFFENELLRKNKKIVVIIFPFANLIGSDRSGAKIQSDLKKNFEANNIPTINLLDYLVGLNGKDLIVNRFDIHPNEKVHALAADLLFNEIKLVLEKKTRK